MLHELEKDQVQLQEKISLMDVEAKKLEDRIKEAFLVEKLRMVK